LTKRVGTRAAFTPTRLRQALLTARTLKPSLGFAAVGVPLLEEFELRLAITGGDPQRRLEAQPPGSGTTSV
jgi:hypothetical protein